MKTIHNIALAAAVCLPMCGFCQAKIRLNSIEIPGDGTKIKFATQDDLKDVRLDVDTQLQNVYQAAVGYTDSVVDEFRSWTNGIWTAVDNRAATVSSNTVETILETSPTSVEVVLDSEHAVEVGATMPNWTTSSIRIVRGNIADGDTSVGGRLVCTPNGQLRNYSVLIEEIPADVLAYGVMSMSFDHIVAKSDNVFVTPAASQITEEMAGGGASCQYGWLLTSNDVPCLVTIREPKAGTVLVRRDKVAQHINNL